ncbi:hypothetical protein AB4Z48_24695 [Cupriavidus sp. 2TAF22]|uniref:hypothetical protein n=1 Tax=unclassified Cupriavidus TaxID=2640874 RepID=UPI003F90DEF4
MNSAPGNGGSDGRNVATLLTLSASYRREERRLASLSWNRTMTGHDRDTGVLPGRRIGYRF